MITSRFPLVIALADKPNVLIHLILVTIHNHPARSFRNIRYGMRGTPLRKKIYKYYLCVSMGRTIFMRPLDPAFLPVVVTGRFQEQTPSKHGLDQSLSGIATGLLPRARVARVNTEAAKMEEYTMPSRCRDIGIYIKAI
jgi:hypothetical protein